MPYLSARGTAHSLGPTLAHACLQRSVNRAGRCAPHRRAARSPSTAVRTPTRDLAMRGAPRMASPRASAATTGQMPSCARLEGRSSRASRQDARTLGASAWQARAPLLFWCPLQRSRRWRPLLLSLTRMRPRGRGCCSEGRTVPTMPMELSPQAPRSRRDRAEIAPRGKLRPLRQEIARWRHRRVLHALGAAVGDRTRGQRQRHRLYSQLSVRPARGALPASHLGIKQRLGETSRQSTHPTVNPSGRSYDYIALQRTLRCCASWW